MFSGPEDATRKFSGKYLLVIRRGFEGMNFAERYLRVISRWKGSKDIEVIALTPEEYERYKEKVKRLLG